MSSAQRIFFQRLASATFLWSTGIAIIFTGYELGFFCMIAGLGLAGLLEFFQMLDQQRLPNYKITALICGAVFFSGGFYFWGTIGSAQSGDFEMLGLLLFLLVVFVRQMFDQARSDRPLAATAYTLLGLLYVPWLFNFMTKIVYVAPKLDGAFTGQYYMLYLIVVAKIGDTGAYVVGSLIGKHPMAPAISPKKSWEGFGGALIFSTAASVGLMMAMPARLSLLNWMHAIILGLLLGMAAVIGDLFESFIKRAMQVKDSGRTLPGIGGALDLIDSLLFTAPVLFFYLQFLLRRTVAGA